MTWNFPEKAANFYELLNQYTFRLNLNSVSIPTNSAYHKQVSLVNSQSIERLNAQIVSFNYFMQLVITNTLCVGVLKKLTFPQSITERSIH